MLELKLAANSDLHKISSVINQSIQANALNPTKQLAIQNDIQLWIKTLFSLENHYRHLSTACTYRLFTNLSSISFSRMRIISDIK